MEDNKKIKSSFKSKRIKDLIFCIVMLLYPTVQFLLFYVGVNFNSILFAFQSYDSKSGFSLTGFTNFSNLFYDLKNVPEISMALLNSLKLYGISLFVTVPLALLFSYYIFKKRLFSGVFRVTLFIPEVVSALVVSMLYKYFTDQALPEIMQKAFNKETFGLFTNPDSRYPTLVFFTLFMGFGTNVLMYSGSMSSIDESIIEYAEIDGTNELQEFWYIALPMIYPTLVTFLVAGIAGIFTNQMNLYSFYGDGAPMELGTLGYYMYKRTLNSKANYPQIASMGLIISLCLVPIVLSIRRALEKFGPSEN